MHNPTMKLAVLLVAAALVATSAAAAAATQTRAASTGVTLTLTATAHTVRAGTPWRFVLRAKDANGNALPASADVRVLAYGQKFDDVGLFGFKGVLSRTYRWSPLLGGTTPTLEAKVTIGRTTKFVRYVVHVNGDTGRPQFRATLTGSAHTAAPGGSWHYLVRAVDARGNSIQGTAIVRVIAHGQIVDTVGWFGFKRRILRAYSWSPQLSGAFALMQAKVVGPGGTRIVTYPVHVT